MTHKVLVWTVETVPATPNLLKECSLKEGQFIIKEHLQIIGLKDALALGDVAYFEKGYWPSNAQVAIQQGKAAAKVVMAVRAGEKSKKFQVFYFGEIVSLVVGDDTIKILDFPVSGNFVFLIRRLIYMAKIQRLLLVSLEPRVWFLGN